VAVIQLVVSLPTPSQSPKQRRAMRPARLTANVRLWLGVLAAMSFVVANIFPFWIALWLGPFILLLGLICVCLKLRSHLLGEFVGGRLDDISGELDELQQNAVRLKHISAFTRSRR
jgi:hypothetical protein